MDPVFDTTRGKLRGAVDDGVASFKGVPYAAPPFGPRHLLPPRAVPPWDGVRDALAFGPKPPQVPYPPAIAEVLAELAGPGEDCLTLNVWTPGPAAEGRPVFVWIPGGVFEFHGTGASALYDGARFARDGVVCVTINYRVGAEGFLYLDDGLANLGLLDQIAALQWVHENIAAFGGDPRRVTVGGQSAGAMSVAALLSMPRARGLFRRAIVQSGTGCHVNSRATAVRIGRRLADLLGVPANREAIAALPPEAVLKAQARLREELLARPDPAVWGEVAQSFLPWAPTVDGDTLPERPVDRVAAGAGADVDLLVGSNTDETRLFFAIDGAIDRMTDAAVVALAASCGLSAEGLDAYRAALPGAGAGDLFAAIQTDWSWRLPAARLADAHAASARARTWMYEFAWRSPQAGGRLGAAHAVEIPFVFDALGAAAEPLVGREPPQALADAMHRAWVAFVADGDCGWPTYDPARRRTMRFDTVRHVVEDPLAAARARWKGAR